MPVPVFFGPARIDIDALPSPAHSPYPASMPGLMSVSDDSEDAANEDMDDDSTESAPHTTAEIVYTFVYDIYAAERARLRLGQETELRSMHLSRDDPGVLAATMWGAYLTIADLFRQPVTGSDEADFRDTAINLLPFFDLLSERFQTHGLDQRVQIVRTNDCIDPDADLLVFKTNSFRRRLLNLKAKHQRISINRTEGFKPPALYKKEDVRMAHAAQSIITLHSGGAAHVQAPFPPHLLRDAFAVRRYEKMCVPGTVYFENMPSLIREVRLLYFLCYICGGSHTWSPSECRRRHVEERLLVSAGYSEVECGTCRLYYPPYLKDEIKYHSQHYVQVYPGTVFLFERVPLAIVAARKHFRVCEACGILHVTTLASPLLLHCPYDLVFLANRFVKITHQYEIDRCTPPANDVQAALNA
jgi:hypothetical protein